MLYIFPENAAFGRVLPKNKIYKNAASGARIKELFVKEVKNITWSYKLSPETVNLPAKNGVHEIQIFTIALKEGTLKHEVLTTIDKAIPSPIFFVLTFENRIRYVAAYKRKSEADKGKQVISSYFETDWMVADAERIPLPVVLDLAALYHTLIKGIIPLPNRADETVVQLAARTEMLRIKKREAERVTAHLRREKQFNRKVELNRVLRGITCEIAELSADYADDAD